MFAIKNLGLAACAALALAFLAPSFSANSALAAADLQSEVKHVNGSNFKTEVEESKVPVIVDFYATWCGPCKLLRPNLEQIAREYGGKVKVVKVDVDTSPDLAKQYGVSRYPTLITFKDGKRQETLIGYRSVEQLRENCEKLLK